MLRAGTCESCNPLPPYVLLLSNSIFCDSAHVSCIQDLLAHCHLKHIHAFTYTVPIMMPATVYRAFSMPHALQQAVDTDNFIFLTTL